MTRRFALTKPFIYLLLCSLFFFAKPSSSFNLEMSFKRFITKIKNRFSNHQATEIKKKLTISKPLNVKIYNSDNRDLKETSRKAFTADEINKALQGVDLKTYSGRKVISSPITTNMRNPHHICDFTYDETTEVIRPTESLTLENHRPLPALDNGHKENLNKLKTTFPDFPIEEPIVPKTPNIASIKKSTSSPSHLVFDINEPPTPLSDLTEYDMTAPNQDSTLDELERQIKICQEGHQEFLALHKEKQAIKAVNKNYLNQEYCDIPVSSVNMTEGYKPLPKEQAPSNWALVSTTFANLANLKNRIVAAFTVNSGTQRRQAIGNKYKPDFKAQAPKKYSQQSCLEHKPLNSFNNNLSKKSQIFLLNGA